VPSIVIPTFDRPGHLAACVRSLAAQQITDDVELLIVDHGRRPIQPDILDAGALRVTVLRGSPDHWWTAAVNLGVRHVLNRAPSRSAVLLLNDDVLVPPGYLTRLTMTHRHAGPRTILGSVGVAEHGLTILDGGTVVDWCTAGYRQPARGRSLNDVRTSSDGPPVCRVSVLGGRGTLIPLEAFRELGLFDEGGLPHYGADWEFTRRAAQHGWSILIDWGALVHTCEHTTGTHSPARAHGLRGIARALTDRTSSHNLRCRWRFARSCAEPGWWPLFFAADLLRTVPSTVYSGVRRGRST